MQGQPQGAARSLIGQRIGRYVVQRELARGGMGVVYEATHEELGQRAAVKVLSEELQKDPNYRQFVARFFDEAKAITRIQHTGIVKIYDQGQLPDGTVFILMEFLEGEPLSRIVEHYGTQGGLPAVHAVGICRQLAASIAEAHKKSILHRDLKPGNVIMVSDSESAIGLRPVLIDFGIARLLDSPYRRTQAGTIMGTPLYMSPEQCRGEDVDDRSDVYALGTILYEMLCGHPPFDGAESNILVRKAMEPPPPLQREKEGLPEELYRLVGQLIHPERNQRPAMSVVVMRLKQLESDLLAATQAAPAAKLHAARTMMAVPGGGEVGRSDAHGATRVTPAHVTLHSGTQRIASGRRGLLLLAVLLALCGIATLAYKFVS